MKNKRILELLEYEYDCIKRNYEGKCDRKCDCCDLVQDTQELLLLYSTLIKEYSRKEHT